MSKDRQYTLYRANIARIRYDEVKKEWIRVIFDLKVHEDLIINVCKDEMLSYLDITQFNGGLPINFTSQDITKSGRKEKINVVHSTNKLVVVATY